MYKMKADGVVFYDPSSDDMAYQVLSPKAKYELNKSGSLTFTMLPGNVLYDGLHKLKTIVTLEQDGEEIFRGRVLETKTDLYNQKEVYCEGELSYLLDTMMRPYEFDGKATDYLALLIENHNADVKDYKKFTLGLTTALTDEDTVKVESEDYTNTLSEIRSLLLDEFNGYLRVRWEDGVRYLDYVDKFNQTCSQEINFGVNLVDIEKNVNAQEVCSVLIPIGKSEKGEITTIEEANDGKDYIESAELVAKYGRIVKTYTFEKVEDPEELLELGKKHMERMQAETTLTITALDLHTVGADVDAIRLGDTVKLVSSPHGLDKEEVCTKIELIIEKPEKSEYTFGLPIETLTDSNASASRKNKRDYGHLHRWLTETENAFDVYVEAANAQINLNATHIDEIGNRVSSAEIEINGLKSEISLKADLILLNGYVKATDLETEVLKVVEGATISDLKTGTFNCSGIGTIATLYATGAVITNLNAPNAIIGGTATEWKEISVVTGGRVEATTATTPPFYNAAGELVTPYVEYVKSVSFVPYTTTISYLGS